MFLENISNKDDDSCPGITVTIVFRPCSSVWPWSVAVARETCHGGTGLSGGGLWRAHQTQETDQPSQDLPKPSGPPPWAAHEPEEVRGHTRTHLFNITWWESCVAADVSRFSFLLKLEKACLFELTGEEKSTSNLLLLLLLFSNWSNSLHAACTAASALCHFDDLTNPIPPPAAMLCKALALRFSYKLLYKAFVCRILVT